MSDELQAAEADIESTVTLDDSNVVEAETPVEGSDSASDTGENQEQKVTFDERQQKVVDDIIGKKTFKVREAERENERLQNELAEARKQIPQEQRPDVPTMPSSFDFDSDEEFNQAVASRDKAIADAARFDGRQTYANEQLERQQQEAQKADNDALQAQVDTYAGRATKLGVKTEDLQAAGNVVAGYGIDDSVVRHILKDEQGPLITTYLAANPVEMETIRSLDPISAGVYLSTIVKQKAEALKPKLTSAPDPVETLRGGGIPEKVHPALQGVKYS